MRAGQTGYIQDAPAEPANEMMVPPFGEFVKGATGTEIGHGEQAVRGQRVHHVVERGTAQPQTSRGQTAADLLDRMMAAGFGEVLQHQQARARDAQAGMAESPDAFLALWIGCGGHRCCACVQALHSMNRRARCQVLPCAGCNAGGACSGARSAAQW